MKTFRTSKRAVSPIIATLLLVAIAVAASVITYTWAMSMTGNQANKSQTQIAIDKVMFGTTSGSTTVNHGTIKGGGSIMSITVDSTSGISIGSSITIPTTGAGADTGLLVTFPTTSTSFTLTTGVQYDHTDGVTISTVNHNPSGNPTLFADASGTLTSIQVSSVDGIAVEDTLHIDADTVTVQAIVDTHTITISSHNFATLRPSGTTVTIDHQTAVIPHLVAATLSSGTTTIPVDTTSGFAIGDSVQIATGATIDSGRITAISAIFSPTITIDTATTNSHTVGLTTTVTTTSNNGIWLSVRNSGSIAATIDTVYLFKGDSLIFQKTNVNTVIPVGGTLAIAFTEGAVPSTNLLSGGAALPSASSTINSGEFQNPLTTNNAYQLKISTNNGFQALGTYYSPGSFS